MSKIAKNDKVDQKVLNVTYDGIFKDFCLQQDDYKYKAAKAFFNSAFQEEFDEDLKQLPNEQRKILMEYIAKGGQNVSTAELKVTDLAFEYKTGEVYNGQYHIFKVLHAEAQRARCNDRYENIIARICEYQNRLHYYNTTKYKKVIIYSIAIINFILQESVPVYTVELSNVMVQNGLKESTYNPNLYNDILVIQLPMLQNVEQKDIQYEWRGMKFKCNDEFYDWLQLLSAEHQSERDKKMMYTIKLHEHTEARKHIKNFFDKVTEPTKKKYITMERTQEAQETIYINGIKLMNDLQRQCDAANEQLNASNEQLNAANEQLNAANEQLNAANEEKIKLQQEIQKLRQQATAPKSSRTLNNNDKLVIDLLLKQKQSISDIAAYLNLTQTIVRKYVNSKRK